jgi:hypothetical protein
MSNAGYWVLLKKHHRAWLRPAVLDSITTRSGCVLSSPARPGDRRLRTSMNRGMSPPRQGRRAKRRSCHVCRRRMQQGGTTSSPPIFQSDLAWPAGSIRWHLAGGFDNDLSGHIRMDSADIRVFTRRREGVGEGVVGIERRRLKGPVLVADPVRAIVVVLPGHRRAGRDSQRRRSEGEVVYLDGGRASPAAVSSGTATASSEPTSTAPSNRAIRRHRCAGLIVVNMALPVRRQACCRSGPEHSCCGHS